MARIRSPNYPALSLPDAIERVRGIHKLQQTTPEPREVVIRHMGYNSVNGRALKSLSALLKYGLLEDADKEGLRVSERAITILFPDPGDPGARAAAISQAAQSPDLFARLLARSEGKRPSADSLQHFLIREGFNMNSIEQVARGFYETLDLVESEGTGYDSFLNAEEESMPKDPAPAGWEPPPPARVVTPAPTGALNSTKPVFDFETVAINTKIDNRDDLAELIERLEQLKGMLPVKTQH